jgi:hypothetical protein
LYDVEGVPRSVNIKPEDVKYFLAQEDPGEDFCQEYMQRFGHLYYEEEPRQKERV